ncbi:isoprenylcysteine carboxylmethyltransferase family protein [Candidatus Pacearchaeota archaeon]|nr:isoprenylcysteine carboxylmethyltransferase family protein [Candidatus Pacearchaeota archaeon]
MVWSIIPIENFPNNAIAIIFNILFIIFFIIEISIIRRIKKYKPRNGKTKDKGSFFIVMLGIFIPLVYSFVIAYNDVGQFSFNTSYLGLLLMAAGFGLRQWSIKTLGRFFTPIVSVHSDHKLIQSGPYKYMRHPSYTGLFLELVGVAFALSNLFATITVMIFFLPAIMYRIMVEEYLLGEHFGKNYESYKQRTKRLIPFVY